MCVEVYCKLEKQPLLFVLAEFGFPIIMRMENLVPELQESFRSMLPHFEEQLSQEIKLQSKGLEVSSYKQWNFIDKEHKKAITVNNSRIICMTSDYDRFDEFKRFCLESLMKLKEIASPAFIERIGLRYADLVTPIGQHSSSEFVHESFYNTDCFSDLGELSHKLSEVLLKTSEGNMIIRSLYGDHGLSVLPDVSDIPIRISSIEQNGKRIILDFDHIFEPSENNDFKFDEKMISEKLDNMHYLSREAFWRFTTEKGRELWR